MKEKVPGLLMLSCKYLNMDKYRLHPPHSLCSRGMLARQTHPGCFQSTLSPKMQAVPPFSLPRDPDPLTHLVSARPHTIGSAVPGQGSSERITGTCPPSLQRHGPVPWARGRDRTLPSFHPQAARCRRLCLVSSDGEQLSHAPWNKPDCH